jgi:hypothetical protein
MTLYNFLIAFAGWVAFNVILFNIKKDSSDAIGESFPVKKYIAEYWDNWLASLVMIPILLHIGSKGLKIPDFGYGEIGWNDIYYPAAGFATELVIIAIKKIKKV